MRISDWSSDVCSSDLVERGRMPALAVAQEGVAGEPRLYFVEGHDLDRSRNERIEGILQNGCPLGARYDHRCFLQADGRHHATLGPGDRAEEVVRLGLETQDGRSAERRVGKRCVSTCRTRW